MAEDAAGRGVGGRRPSVAPTRRVMAFVATGVVFGVLDGLWLGVIAGDLYAEQLGPLAADPINWPAALAFYVVYVLGVTYFATLPGVASRSVRRAAAQGGALGLVAYATFDLTNWAVIEGYPGLMVPVDIAWGTVATCAAASIATALARPSE